MPEKPSSEKHDSSLPVGKVPEDFLVHLLQLPRAASPDVLINAGYGEDAAVRRSRSRLIAVSSDPITFPTARPGSMAVHVNANDIAVMGAAPTFFTATLMVPPGSSRRMIESIMRDMLEAADRLDIVLIGGHTEITDAVTLPVLSLTMFGELLCDRPPASANAQPGDRIIQVNPLGLEGSAILAGEYQERLAVSLDEAELETARAFAEDPGISVVAPAHFAAVRLPVHAMHDPTEGGLATGLREIAFASGCGLRIRKDRLIIRSETARICNCLGIDPLGLISSGCLLFTLPHAHAESALHLMHASGFNAADIGEMLADTECLEIERADGAVEDLPCFQVDEIARLLATRATSSPTAV